MFSVLFGNNSVPDQVIENNISDELRKTIHDFATKLVEGECILSTIITFSENDSRPKCSTVGFDWLDDLKEKKMPRNSCMGMFGISSVNSVCKVTLKAFDPDTKVQNRINIHIGQPEGIFKVFSESNLQSYLSQNNSHCNGYFVSDELDELIRSGKYTSSTTVIVEKSDHTSKPSVTVMEQDVDNEDQSCTSIVFNDFDEFSKNIGIIKEELDKVLNKENSKGFKKQFGKN